MGGRSSSVPADVARYSSRNMFAVSAVDGDMSDARRGCPLLWHPTLAGLRPCFEEDVVFVLENANPSPVLKRRKVQRRQRKKMEEQHSHRISFGSLSLAHSLFLFCVF
mmetsp:Transcript_7975/g.15548  ORF Transcript_7975/g.15548 Transcript_7975/m.15548 type:complete len:108 (+) Transcript_7975:779-1102(+)